MPRALVVQHAPIESLGRLAEWLPAVGIDLEVIQPYAGDAVPTTIEADALIVMGGPMGVYDDDVVGWLPAVRRLLAMAADGGVPTLGVCLGAQLLAVATGGRVERGGNGPEIGLSEVSVAVTDELLEVGTIPVAQWHYDTVTELPPDATLLASSESYPVQAFRVGERAWGLQFHVEAAPELVATWARVEERDVAAIVDPLVAADAEIAAVGQTVAQRFAEVIRSRQ